MNTEPVKSVLTGVTPRDLSYVAPRRPPEPIIEIPDNTSIQTAGDTVDFSRLAREVSELSLRAKVEMAEVSVSKVNAARIALETGTYPPPLVVEGLTRLLGIALASSGPSPADNAPKS